jgi:hypothetical protein
MPQVNKDLPHVSTDTMVCANLPQILDIFLHSLCRYFFNHSRLHPRLSMIRRPQAKFQEYSFSTAESSISLLPPPSDFREQEVHNWLSFSFLSQSVSPNGVRGRGHPGARCTSSTVTYCMGRPYLDEDMGKGTPLNTRDHQNEPDLIFGLTEI